jgi:hypothetical protein
MGLDVNEEDHRVLPGSADVRLEQWSRQWGVHSPDFYCKGCGSMQPISSGMEPFNGRHSTWCEFRSELPQFPWRDLAEIIEDWKREIGAASGHSS